MRTKFLALHILVPALFMVISTPATAERIALPGGVFYYKPAASVFGSEAAWVNPAALGRYKSSGFQVIGDLTNDDLFRNWGSVSNREQLAVAYRYLDNPAGKNIHEWVFASGLSLGGRLHFGGSYRYFKDGPDDLRKRHLWNIGLLDSGGSNFSVAAVFSNLNRGRLRGERTETEQRYSVSYRPMGKLVTVSVDMLLSTKTKLKNADYVYHLELRPRAGLHIEGFVNSDEEFQIGVRANLVQYFVGVQSHFGGGDHVRTTAYAGATSQRQPSLIPPRGRRLSAGLSGGLPENPPQPVFGSRRTSFVGLLTTIYRASEDPSIRELVLSLRGLSLGFGQAQELREAITHFMNSGKAVVCHLSYPNNIGYFVASATDSILIPPVSRLNLVGLRAELTFYAGTLDKLGIKADILRIGDHKTAPERFTEQASSEQNRRQVNRILDDIYDQFLAAIAQGRGVSTDSARVIIDNGPYTSEEALAYGLVDGLSYRDEMKENFLRRLPEISFRRYLDDTVLNDGWPPEPKLAVVVAEGDIGLEKGPRFPFDNDGDVTPSAMEQAFKRAFSQPGVAGVIFRVNSPGGYALAGEEIYHSASKAAQEKFLVTSMSNVAASGGYHVTMPSARIFANPGTITGSVGIYGGKVDLSGLYEKIDLGKELYLRGRFAGMESTVRPFTPEEREKYYSHLKAFYDHFVQLVADNRSLPSDSVDALSRGKVWTGREALANGLIDELGGLKRSLDYVAERLDLDDYRIVVYPEKRPWIILPGKSALSAVSRLFARKTDDGFSTADIFTGVPEEGGILARLPFDISIK